MKGLSAIKAAPDFVLKTVREHLIMSAAEIKSKQQQSNKHSSDFIISPILAQGVNASIARRAVARCNIPLLNQLAALSWSWNYIIL